MAWDVIRPQLTKPYVYDEAAFAFAGHAVAQSGIPLSNVGHMQTETPGDFSQRFNWALWHPPLYVFLLGNAFRLWGESETVARLVGVACNALAALLVFLTALVVLWRDGAGQRRRAAPVFAAVGAALYLTNPFVVQSALLLDIDGTVLVASIALLAFLYVLFLRFGNGLRRPRHLAPAGDGDLRLRPLPGGQDDHLPGPGRRRRRLAPGGDSPWRPWRALIDLPVVLLGGAGLFLATWWAACAALGMPFWLPFRILDIELRDATSSPAAWRENPRALLDMVSYVALWVSPYLILLFAWAGFARLGDLLLRPPLHLWRWLRGGPPAASPGGPARWTSSSPPARPSPWPT